MSGIAVAIGASALIGGIVSSNSARSATRSQQRAASDANAVQLQMFEQQRKDQQPWQSAGRSALSTLVGEMPQSSRNFTMDDFQTDPGYQFRMDQGTRAIERSAAARGGLGSGNTLKALSRFGQGLASDEYLNAYNRFRDGQSMRFNQLSNLAGLGQTATNQMGQASQAYGNNASNNLMQAGNAAAAGKIAQGNAIAGAAQSGVNNWMGYQMVNRMYPK